MDRLTSIVEQVKASSALERERGLLSLRQLLEGISEEEQNALEARLAGRVSWLVQSEQWTHRLAALSLSKASLAFAKSAKKLQRHAMTQLMLGRQQAQTGELDHDNLQGEALEACLMLLEDPEPRVRLSVSECMHLLAEQQGMAVWLRSRDTILQSISASWDRDALLQGPSFADRTPLSAATPPSDVPQAHQGAGGMRSTVHRARNSSEFELPHALAQSGRTGVIQAADSGASSPSARSAPLEQLQEMRIVAQHQNGNCTAASSAAETSASARVGDDRAAQHSSRPAQGHDAQAVPAVQDSVSMQVRSIQSMDVQQDSAHTQGDFLTELLSSSYTRHAPGTGDMRHDTEGWRCLETSFKVLQQIILGCGQEFGPHVTPELLDVLFRALLHQNRFVRETCYHIVAALCTLCSHAQLLGFSDSVAAQLQDGLNENWSQVRFAACVAGRSFMLALGADKERYYAQLLPSLCFNRYDVAEGVSVYSQATWRQVMGDEGRTLVARCLPQVLEHYVRCSRTNNHTTREAACTCITELASKIDAEAVRPHVPVMLRTLITCLRDDSWPVRDAALLASGKCAGSFPEECRAALPELCKLWTGHLDDNIPSVRADAAAALGDALQAYRQELLEQLLPLIRTMLPKARGQQASSMGSNTGQPLQLPKAMPGTRVVSAEQRKPDQGGLFQDTGLTRSKDTGGVDYSCGCMDYGFRRPKEAWEASDGAVHLLKELSERTPEAVPEFMPELAEIAALEDFEACRSLQTAIWKQLPCIAKGLGKRMFKRYMDLFWDPLFRSLQCRHPLCEAAAAQCLAALSSYIGPRILEGHLTEEQQTILAARGLRQSPMA